MNYAEKEAGHRADRKRAQAFPSSSVAGVRGEAPVRALGEPATLGNQAMQRRLGARDAAASVATAGPGAPLPDALRKTMGARLRQDLGTVRVHTGADAATLTQEHNAAAMTWNEHILFAPGEFRPASARGLGLLAHELAHVLQFRQPPTSAASRHTLEAQARQLSVQARMPGPLHPITARAAPERGFLFDEKDGANASDALPPDLFKDWKDSPDSLLLILGDDKLFILPGAGNVFIPTEKTREEFLKSSSHVTQDLGSLFEVPASGASGTRLFATGKRSAMVLDAGYDVAPGQKGPVAAVYADQVLAIARRYGISNISRIQPIHGHGDHVAGIPIFVGIPPKVGIPTLLGRLNIKAANVVVPAEYRNLPAVAEVIQALASTTDATLVERGFGKGFTAQPAPKDKGGPGDLYQSRFMVGELVVDMVALRPALKNAASQTDLASYLTRVTRRTDNASVVILGDLRGTDLEAIRNTMEAQRPGSWKEFFRDVLTISGFSHHAGAMKPGDVPGMMALLDATLLAHGNLRVVEQTNLGFSTQARSDTLELIARTGIDLAYTGMPTAGSAPSAAGATKNTLTATGPNAILQPVIASPLSTGLARLRNLLQSRQTIGQWRPWLEEINGKEAVDALQAQIESSVIELQRSLRPAIEAASGVRVAARAAGTTGPRDYTSGSATGRVFTTALAAIPAETPAERSLTPAVLRNLEELRNRNVEEVPLNVAVYRAVTRGEYSDKAFSYMMSQLHPRTRDELVNRKPGTSGALTPRHVAFQRVRAQFNFERSVMPGETISIGRFATPGKIGARGVGGVLLAAELWTSIGQPLWQSYQSSKQINIRRNLAPFLRRIAFWQTMGVPPNIVGVIDPLIGSPKLVEDPAKVESKLEGNDLDALYIKAPGVDDAGVLRMATWLTAHVRNYDEYATFFEDSFQDALRYQVKAGENWSESSWQVRVGYYETSGSNHVEEQWCDHPKLTELMRHYLPWLIANTRSLLQQAAVGGEPPRDFHAMLGTLTALEAAGTTAALPTVRLRHPEHAPVVTVPWSGIGADSWNKQEGQQPATLNVPGAPLFFVLGRRGSGANAELKVTGADFETFAAIRDLRTTHLEIGTYGDVLNHVDTTTTRNQAGWVWIDAVLTAPVAQEAGATGKTAPAPAPQPPAVPAQPAPLPSMPSPQPFRATGWPGVPRDVWSPKLPVGPRLFGPLPNDPTTEENKRWIGPGVGGSF
jgi:hypothetical protein